MQEHSLCSYNTGVVWAILKIIEFDILNSGQSHAKDNIPHEKPHSVVSLRYLGSCYDSSSHIPAIKCHWNMVF